MRREIWVGANGEVMRYNLAYINPLLNAADGGRVLGYDNAHGEHHRHHLGTVTPIAFVSFAQIERRFQSEWQTLIKETKHAKD